MSTILKAAAVTLVVGLACCCFGLKAIAMELEECDDEPGEVPIYYLQLLDYAVEKSREDEEGKPEILKYIVEPGDCLYTIAGRFGTDVDTLVRLNDVLNPALIHPGDGLEILTVVGCIHDVSEGDTVAAIATAYGVDENIIREANELGEKPVLSRGERIIVPGGIASRKSQRASFSWPLQGRLTSGYGWRGEKFHYGIDIAAPYGTAFSAAGAGTITHAGYRGNYGVMIEVDHGGGFLTRYGHASEAAVKVGQQVSMGDTIGYIGLTGNTTGPHLHFEIYSKGKKVNPIKYLP